MYQTYRTDAENPYVSGYIREGRWVRGKEQDSEEELDQLEADTINHEPESPDETQGLVNDPSYIDNDDQWEDTVQHLDSDIRDIMITGKVRPAFSLWSLPMRALYACQYWGVEPDTWVSTPCHVLAVSRTKSLGNIRRMNTDYHHGDRPAGSIWFGGQMRTGDHEHPLVGRIRPWDALIILRRLPVSPRFPTSISSGFGPGFFSPFIFPSR